jgi:hypothetical protein
MLLPHPHRLGLLPSGLRGGNKCRKPRRDSLLDGKPVINGNFYFPGHFAANGANLRRAMNRCRAGGFWPVTNFTVARLRKSSVKVRVDTRTVRFSPFGLIRLTDLGKIRRYKMNAGSGRSHQSPANRGRSH